MAGEPFNIAGQRSTATGFRPERCSTRSSQIGQSTLSSARTAPWRVRALPMSLQSAVSRKSRTAACRLSCRTKRSFQRCGSAFFAYAPLGRLRISPVWVWAVCAHGLDLRELATSNHRLRVVGQVDAANHRLQHRQCVHCDRDTTGTCHAQGASFRDRPSAVPSKKLPRQ